jgi:hypothetical protein
VRLPTPCGYIHVCDFLKAFTVGISLSLRSPKHQLPNTAIKLNNIITPYDLDTRIVGTVMQYITGMIEELEEALTDF